MRIPTALAALAVVVQVSLAFGQCEQKQLSKILVPEPAPADNFGNRIALDGTRALIGKGTTMGAVYIYEQGPNNSWLQAGKLTGALNEGFGAAVALDDGLAVVTAPSAFPFGQPTPGEYLGAAYVYEKIGPAWVLTTTLTPLDVGPGSFGSDVVVSGTTIAVGCYAKDNHQGAVYVFDKQGTAWVQTAKVVPNDAKPGIEFGFSVTMDGSRLLVGALEADGLTASSGAAYVFEKQGSSWLQEAKLVAAGEGVGSRVRLAGDRALVTANNAVFVFEKVGPFWIQFAKLTDDGDNGFGSSIALGNSRIVVGVPRDSDGGNQAGAVYVYEQQAGAWVERIKLTAADAMPTTYFGYSVAVDGDVGLVGATGPAEQAIKHGDVYFFTVVPNPPPEYGTGCPGSGGFAPEFSLDLSYDGCVFPGTNLAFSLSNGLGGSVALLLFGLSNTQAPVTPECNLLVSPSPINVVVPLLGAGPGGGAISFSSTIPLSSPSVSIYGQGFVADPGVPRGFSATNGVRITIQ